MSTSTNQVSENQEVVDPAYFMRKQWLAWVRRVESNPGRYFGWTETLFEAAFWLARAEDLWVDGHHERLTKEQNDMMRAFLKEVSEHEDKVFQEHFKRTGNLYDVHVSRVYGAVLRRKS